MRYSLTVLFFLLVSVLISQQETEKYQLASFRFEGLSKTQDFYLLDLLDPPLGENVEKSSLEYYLQILRNLPSVANATYNIEISGTDLHVTFEIKERRTALPIINFGGIRDNIWFQIGANENNFRGVGDVLLGYYQNNDLRHTFKVHYRKQRILNSHWGYGFTINKWSSIEPIFFNEETVEYNYDNNGINAIIIRNFGVRSQLALEGTYFVEDYEKLSAQSNPASPGPDAFSIKKFLTKVEFKRNKLDYHFFYLKGHETNLSYQNVVSFGQQFNFNSLLFLGKYFLRPSKKLNLGFRLTLGIASNRDSPFAPFVADSHVNIRGIGNRIERGTAQAILNFEGRYTLYHRKSLSSQLVFFADTGSWRNPGGQLRNIFDAEQLREFVGLGLRINFQKVFGATFRIDYGVDIFDVNQRGLVIGLGQYF